MASPSVAAAVMRPSVGTVAVVAAMVMMVAAMVMSREADSNTTRELVREPHCCSMHTRHYVAECRLMSSEADSKRRWSDKAHCCSIHTVVEEEG